MISKEEFDSIYNSVVPISQNAIDITVFGCITLSGVPVFGVNFIRDNTQHWFYLYMTHPEIFYNYEDDYKITKDDIDKMMNILVENDKWNNIIESTKEILSRDDYDDRFFIDFSKVPLTPPDYHELVK